MKAVVFRDYGQAPTLVDVPPPDCPDNGVLVRVAATGVCRSDWHAWRGHDPVALPHIPGHELAGTVAATGPRVTGWHVGARVTVPFVCGCGECGYCLAGESQVCPQQTQPGFTGPGSFAELVAIHAADTNLVAVPDSIELTTAASLGCRFATAFRALATHAQVRRDEWVVVHGCGGVGLSAVMIAAALGARVVAVDVSAAALSRATDLGADFVLDAAVRPDVVPQITDLTGGGAHVSLDALGAADTAVASVRCLRPRGRHVQVGLLFGTSATPPLPLNRVIRDELAIYGAHGMPARDYPKMLALVADGTLRPDLLVGKLIGLEDAGAALLAMDQPPVSAGMTMVQISTPGTC